MKNYRYSLTEAIAFYGVSEHPQLQMKKLEAKVIKSEAVAIADCWFFRTENEIDPLPKYIEELSDDFKFSDEMENFRN